VNGKGSTKQLKKKLYLAMANVNLLEGLRFYVSFACTFAFGELKLMEGSAKILSLIARDESQHLAITTAILKNWQAGDDREMKSIVKECEDEVIKMYIKGVGMTKFDFLDKPSHLIAYEAAYNAINDSSISIKDIDAVVFGNLDIDTNGERQRHIVTMLSSLFKKNLPINAVGNLIRFPP